MSINVKLYDPARKESVNLVDVGYNTKISEIKKAMQVKKNIEKTSLIRIFQGTRHLNDDIVIGNLSLDSEGTVSLYCSYFKTEKDFKDIQNLVLNNRKSDIVMDKGGRVGTNRDKFRRLGIALGYLTKLLEVFFLVMPCIAILAYCSSYIQSSVNKMGSESRSFSRSMRSSVIFVGIVSLAVYIITMDIEWTLAKFTTAITIFFQSMFPTWALEDFRRKYA